MRFRSLLTNLRKLTLRGVAVYLPALQPVATRLHELNINASRLHGSAHGFLTRGWTALTALSLVNARVETATMTAALELPALEYLDIIGFRHPGGVLQLDQLTSSCPNITGLRLQLDSDLARGREGRGPCCSLLDLGRLTKLYMYILEESHANLDFNLPASLTHFEVEGGEDGECVVDFFWALSEAVKCVGRGAQLHKFTCLRAEAYLQPAQWGASLDEQYRRLGGQLSSVTQLEVRSSQESVCALSAVVSSAPSLTCVTLTLIESLPHLELPAISSASLEIFIVVVDMYVEEEAPIPPMVLTFLPGCTRLQKVLVRLIEAPLEGTAVKIRCHACSPTCIAPLNVHASQTDRVCTLVYAGDFCEVGVEFLPGPPSPQGVQRYTVLWACHAAGPQQPYTWGHVVMPGFL